MMTCLVLRNGRGLIATCLIVLAATTRTPGVHPHGRWLTLTSVMTPLFAKVSAQIDF